MKTILTIALAALVAVPALAQTPSRDDAVAAWGKAHAKAAASEPTIDRLRDIAAADLGQMRDGEVVAAALASVDRLLVEGDYAPAQALADRLLAWVRAHGTGPEDEYDTYTRVGSVRYYLADYDGAAEGLGAAAAAAARIVPLDRNAVANARANFAVVLDQAGRYREAEMALLTAIAERRQASPFRPSGTAVALAALAAVEKRLGRADLADARYREALGTFESGGLTTSPSYPVMLHNYAVFLAEQGRSEDAVKLYRSSLERFPPEQRRAANKIPDHSALAATLIQLGRLDEAEAALADALAIADRLEKPTVDVSAAYGHRSALWEARGDLARAEADARKALAIDLALRGGDDNLDVVGDLDALARILLKRGARDEADSLSRRAVAALATLPPGNAVHALVLDGRAATLAARGEAGAALAAARRASELQLVRLQREEALEARALTAEERPIIERRIELLWRSAAR